LREFNQPCLTKESMTMRFAGIVLALPLVFVLCSHAFAQAPAPALAAESDPGSLGFSASRLARIAPWYQAQIDAGALPGAVVAIARQGKLAYLQAIGFQDRAKKIPMQPDSIFWLASMTKPVNSVAAMMLVEQGKLDLAAPVSRYLPEFENTQVGVETTNPSGKTELAFVPQKRAMTVLDLVRMTAGLVQSAKGSGPVHSFNRQIWARRDQSLAEFIATLATRPLAYQPGEVWEYSDWSIDTLGRVVEVASGEPLDQFLESHIFKPLGMVDTGFYVPEAKLSRLVDPAPEGRDALFDVVKPPRYFSGSGGLVSTAPDYLRFCQMLLNGGELDGVRILTPATVALMTTSSLPATVRFAGIAAQLMGPEQGTSWGLGFAIRTDPESSWVPGSVGSFAWSGAWGTYFWIDPAVQLIGVQMVQVPREDNQRYFDAIRHLTFAALDLSGPAPAEPDPPARVVGESMLSAYVGRYYFGASLSASDLQSTARSVFGGIGLNLTKDGGRATVDPFAGGPAEKAGVMKGDILSSIDGVATDALSLGEFIGKLRGKAGTTTTLTLLRAGSATPLTITVERRTITLPGAEFTIRLEDGKLLAEATGIWPVLEIEKGRSVELRPLSRTEFSLDSSERTRLAFLDDQAGKISGVALNPGPLAINGVKVN
jgi:CubicO group peptidase (beta-lactamase class C family)